MKFSNNLIVMNNLKFINNSLYIYNNFIKIFINDEIKNNSVLHTFLNINNYIFFLFKKEKIYTKLKYSRVPQVDIASGSAASLFAGLIGFLITEKFGFELLDSGDFYVLVVYVFLIIVILRIFILTYLSHINNYKNNLFLSIYPFIYYIKCLKKFFFK